MRRSISSFRFFPFPPLLVVLLWGVVVMGMFACHHPRRNNPFDPVLTPAVELVVTPNDTTGTVTLIWTPYEGDQPFAEYRILRNEADRITVDTLTVIREVTQVSFVDLQRKPNTEYVYRVAVVNTRGFVHPSQEHRVPAYRAGPVVILDMQVDAQRGTATVRWNRFQGGRFVAYRVERLRVGEVDFLPIQRVETVEDTVFTDEDLSPDIEVFYRIVVEAAGRSGRVFVLGR